MEEDPIRNKRIKFWQDFWPSILQTTRETENHIDTKVYGISIGGIGVEVASFQFIKDPQFLYLAWASCLLFVLALFLNLFAHVKSLKSQEKERQCISDYIKDENVIDDSFIYDIIEDENREITEINKYSIKSMLVAVLCIIVFVLLNIE
jgi:hypothetical protein